MKKILALFVALCLLSALFIPALAAEDTITVYVDAPPDWNEVALYVWFDNGAGGTTEWKPWPGVVMSDDDGDGWYALEIPAGQNNRVIANNNNNGVQTIDLTMDGAIDCWLTVNGNGDGTKLGGDVTYDNPGAALDDMPTAAPTEPVVQELKSLALVGSGLPGIGEWVVEDAAGDMTKVSDTVWTKELAVTNGATLTFKVAGNDAWDSGYNFGGAEDPTAVTVGTALAMVSGNESKNMTLTATKDCTLKFTVTLAEDGTASLLIEESEGAAPTEPSETEPSKPADTEPSETQPSESKPADETPAPKNNKGTAILVLSLVLVLLLGVAVVISIVPGKNAV